MDHDRRGRERRTAPPREIRADAAAPVWTATLLGRCFAHRLAHELALRELRSGLNAAVQWFERSRRHCVRVASAFCKSSPRAARIRLRAVPAAQSARGARSEDAQAVRRDQNGNSAQERALTERPDPDV